MQSVTRCSSAIAATLFRYKSNVPSECSPGDGTPLIVYKNLVSDIEAVFTVEELEKKSAVTNVEQVPFYWRRLLRIISVSQVTAEVHSDGICSVFSRVVLKLQEVLRIFRTESVRTERGRRQTPSRAKLCSDLVCLRAIPFANTNLFTPQGE